jgi:diadenosine tetraphosphatase ApaH/serine/threonine PP2A family protein phosphatase
MRYGIISDIHGNLEALTAVLTECRRINVGSILCAGDIVGYGADPRACLKIIRDLKAPTVAGNHDWAVAGKLDFSYFTSDGRAAVIWSQGQLTLEDMTYLNGLPLLLKNQDCILVHGTPNQPEEFTYLTDSAQAAEGFLAVDAGVCFVGHTHVPSVFIQRDDGVMLSDRLDFDVDMQYKYIVNLGSVGQPRDGNPMASFCVYDSAVGAVENHRVIYDIKTAQEKILRAGLPETLAMRLERGL